MKTLTPILSLAHPYSVRLRYFRDNSTIKLKALIQSLACDLDVELKPPLAAAGKRVSLFDCFPLHDLSSNRRKSGWILSGTYFLSASTKGMC